MIRAATFLTFKFNASPEILRVGKPAIVCCEASNHIPATFSLKQDVITLIQLDPSNPINSVLLIIMVIILGVWIAAELRYDGMGKSVIRIVSALALCVLFMIIMYTSGLIYF